MEKSSNFSSFSQNFNISVTSGGKLHIHLLNVVVLFIVFLYSATLICRGADISKCSKRTLEFEITRVDCTCVSDMERLASLLIVGYS